MNNNVRQLYKVNKSDIETAYINQIGLKMNKEYERWADNTTIALIEQFLKEYKGVVIEIPKAREKSPKSLLGKIKNLQIERISKLYNIENVSLKEKKELFNLIKERLNENEELDIASILNTIRKLIFLDEVNIDEFEKKIMVEGISKSTKTALLRILVSKIKNVKEYYEYLDNKYGKKAAERTGFEEDDLIRYESVQSIKDSEEKTKKLKTPQKFLKATDLRGMKIVVIDVPDNFKTDNERIKELLEGRSKCKNNEERALYTNKIILEIGKEFYNNIEKNEEFLKEQKMNIIPESYKHKCKKNGYEAEHIKFYNTKNPEYTLEMQFKSEYVENIAKGEGSASHQNRPGKKRVLPKTNNNTEFVNKLNNIVPKYTLYPIVKGKIQKQKQSMAENVLWYFQTQISDEDPLYNKIVELYRKENSKQIVG